jgi:ribosome biogenesis GTPase
VQLEGGGARGSVRAVLRRRLLAGRRTARHVLAPGDLVGVAPAGTAGDDSSIEEIHTRRNQITRSTGGRFAQVLYANVDRLVIVGSVDRPPLRPGLFDRFLVAAEREGIAALLVVNKTDLGVTDSVREFERVYREVGYPVVLCCAGTGAGLGDLEDALGGATLNVFAGHSGVGKSTLLNRLYPGFEQTTGEVSRVGRGRHVTTQTLLLQVEPGRYVADTPGVRAFALHDLLPEELGFYFRELVTYIPACRFKGCTHTHEPACAVKDAVERGEVAGLRYQSYRRILESLGGEEADVDEEENRS